jgi:hypothetical protein
MFTWINKQGVQSDGGFTLQITGRFSAEYREGSKKVSFETDNGVNGGETCIIIDPDAIQRWDGDPVSVQLSAAERERVIGNIREALKFQGLRLV